MGERPRALLGPEDEDPGPEELMAPDDETRPRKARTSKPRKTPEAKSSRSRAKPAKVDTARGGAAAKEVEEFDAQGGDVAKSASRSRAASSAARAAAPEPSARDYLEPSHDEVARRAYLRYRETGNEDAFDNWIQAERQLREEQLRKEE